MRNRCEASIGVGRRTLLDEVWAFLRSTPRLRSDPDAQTGHFDVAVYWELA